MKYYLPGTYNVFKKTITKAGEVYIAKYNFTVATEEIICTPVYEPYTYEEKGALKAEIIANKEYRNVFIEAGDGVYFKFVAPKDGIYTFSGIGSINTLGRIYVENNNLLAESLDGGIGENFAVFFSMNAGQTYYIEARAEENNVTASFVVRCN